MRKIQDGMRQLPFHILWINHQKEVAEKMGISVDTLYSTLYRAKQWIKKYYEEQFHQLDGK